MLYLFYLADYVVFDDRKLSKRKNFLFYDYQGSFLLCPLAKNNLICLKTLV